MTIYFDMDGTIANLYGVEDWLNKLKNEDASPYTEATPMLNFRKFAKLLKAVQRRGHEIGIISWLSKEATPDYNEAVRKAKKYWLKRHLPSVSWNEIHIIKYGAPKHFNCQYNSGILFYYNESVRKLWNKRVKIISEKENTEFLKKIGEDTALASIPVRWEKVEEFSSIFFREILFRRVASKSFPKSSCVFLRV